MPGTIFWKVAPGLMAYTVAPVPANRCTPLPAPPGLHIQMVFCNFLSVLEREWVIRDALLYWDRIKNMVLKGVYARYMHETISISEVEKKRSRRLKLSVQKPVRPIYCLWLRDIVDSGIGLSYPPASICFLAGRYDNPMPELTLFPPLGTKNLATAVERGGRWRGNPNLLPTTYLISQLILGYFI
jgi:hypothetical protein